MREPVASVASPKAVMLARPRRVSTAVPAMCRAPVRWREAVCARVREEEGPRVRFCRRCTAPAE